MQYESSSIYYLEVMTNVDFKTKIGQMSRSKGLVPTVRSYHKEYSCEISKCSSTHWSKVISKVKVSERRKEWQNDTMTDRIKTIWNMPPPPPDLGGIKT